MAPLAPWSKLAHLSPTSIPDLTDKVTRPDNQYYAAGGFGDVFRCEYVDEDGTKEVAVKAFRLSFSVEEDEYDEIKAARMIRRELGIWRRLDHRNIVPFLGIAYGFGRRGNASLVSLWMPHGTLHAYLKVHDEELVVTRRLQLLLDVANGLHYLHSFPVIHGDLTSSNVLVDHNHTARLTDFGMSRAKPGTLRWAAPEHFSFEKEDTIYTIKSDIYSFGNIALLVLSGKYPWSEVRRDAAVVLHLSKGHTPGRPLSRPIDDQHWALIERCWSSIPERPLAEDIISSLQEHLPVVKVSGMDTIELVRVGNQNDSADNGNLDDVPARALGPPPASSAHNTPVRSPAQSPTSHDMVMPPERSDDPDGAGYENSPSPKQNATATDDSSTWQLGYGNNLTGVNLERFRQHRYAEREVANGSQHCDNWNQSYMTQDQLIGQGFPSVSSDLNLDPIRADTMSLPDVPHLSVPLGYFHDSYMDLTLHLASVDPHDPLMQESAGLISKDVPCDALRPLGSEFSVLKVPQGRHEEPVNVAATPICQWLIDGLPSGESFLPGGELKHDLSFMNPTNQPYTPLLAGPSMNKPYPSSAFDHVPTHLVPGRLFPPYPRPCREVGFLEGWDSCEDDFSSPYQTCHQHCTTQGTWDINTDRLIGFQSVRSNFNQDAVRAYTMSLPDVPRLFFPPNYFPDSCMDPTLNLAGLDPYDPLVQELAALISKDVPSDALLALGSGFDVQNVLQGCHEEPVRVAATPVCQWLTGGLLCGASFLPGAKLKHSISQHLHKAHGFRPLNARLAQRCMWLGCDKQLKQGSFVRHVLTVHLRIAEICEGCGTSFARRDSLQRHIRNSCGSSQQNPSSLGILPVTDLGKFSRC